jgi:CRP-like cAMP-binding protein
MFAVSKQSVENHLLSSIPPREFGVIQPYLEWVALPPRGRLSEANQRIQHAYFIGSGICSVVAVNKAGVHVETAIVGREGFIGAPVVLSVDRSPYEIIVQADGRALRLSQGAFTEVLKKCLQLKQLVLRFIHIFGVQTAHTSLANACFTLEQRLARWLLMCHDRVDGDEVTMTQEFLSLMLADEPSSIKGAVRSLEGKGLIQSTTGRMKILNREGLEEASAGAYGVPEQEYERLIAPLRKRLHA